MKRPVHLADLVELLARGVPVASIATALGYRTRKGVDASLKRRRIRRLWTVDGIPVVEVRR